MKKIVIFGTGSSAEKFLYQNRELEVMFFLDNSDKKENKLYHGSMIYKPEKFSMKELKMYKIVICSDYYWEISKQLIDIGLKEFEDFIPKSLFRKKMVFLIGNCHMSVIAAMLSSNKIFNSKYGLYTTPLIEMLSGNSSINMELDRWDTILKYADIIISQDIQENNSISYYFSQNYVKKKVKPTCINITILNTYGCGRIYYPWAEFHNPYNSTNMTCPFGYFPTNDTLINNLYSVGKNEEEIIRILCDDNLYTTSELEKNIEMILKKYEKREMNCDIKIMHYIRAEYKNKLLFYDEKHPTNEVLFQQTIGILKYLNLYRKAESSFSELYPCLKGYALPIYPSIINKLKLNFGWEYNKSIRAKNEINLSDKKMNIEEYVRQYIFYCGKLIKSVRKNSNLIETIDEIKIIR